MDPNNSGFILEDAMNESDFTAVSSLEMNMKQITDKIQKLENMAMKNPNGTNVGDQSGMIQISWQMGKEIGELKKENEGLKDGMTKMLKAFEEIKKTNDGLKDENAEKGHEIEEMKKEIEGLKAAKQEENHVIEELKEENGRKFREMAELIAQISGKNAELEREIVEKGRKIEEVKAENEGLKEAMSKLKIEIAGKNIQLDGQIAELKKEEEEKLKENMREMQGKIEEIAISAEQIGRIEWVKYNSNEFKLDAAKCGPKLTISEGGFVAKHSGPNERNIVLASLPIPSYNLNLNGINKSTIAFYFEVQILCHTNAHKGCLIDIGFCAQQFSLDSSWLGNENSIGIYGKGLMLIEGKTTKLGNADGSFSTGDFVGIGIIHKKNSKMECFATWNGQLQGKAEMPSKFLDFQLYPAINLYYAGDTIRLNFDKENCQFKDFGRVLQ